MSPKSHGFLNSCYANMEQKIKGQGEQSVLINSRRCSKPGASSMEIGCRCRTRAAHSRVSPRSPSDVNPGIVVATLGYWRQLNEGTVNSISSAEFTDMGHAPSFSDNLVEVALAN